ncbi:unnamed protein product [Coregonus sp. 'balchen']|nr:unnamed protein product [Coregonus sp. 'balchen']
MRITLVTVATAMVCLMGVYGDVQPQRDFDLQRFAGKWYRVGLAYDSPGFTALYRDKLRVSMGILNPQTNGNVNLTMWTQRSSGCRSKFYTYEKTAIPGAFTYFSTRRSQKVKNDVIQKFRDFATSRGFPKDAILTPPPAGSSLKNCPPAGR